MDLNAHIQIVEAYIRETADVIKKVSGKIEQLEVEILTLSARQPQDDARTKEINEKKEERKLLMEEENQLRYEKKILMEKEKELRKNLMKSEQAETNRSNEVMPGQDCINTYAEWQDCHSVQEVKEYVKSLIEKHTHADSKLSKLIMNNEYPGVEYTSSLLKASLADKIYKLESKLPNLLLFGLKQLNYPSGRKEKIDKLGKSVNDSEYVVIYGPSGCGKTRAAYEFLSQNFGIFLTASTCQNLGSNDLSNVLKSNLKSRSLASSVRLYFQMQGIIAVRLIFLDVLRQVYGDRVKPYHWLIVQLASASLFDTDIFDLLSQRFRVKLENNEVEKCKPEQSLQYLPIFLDETQMLFQHNRLYCSATSLDCLMIELSRNKISTPAKLDRSPLSTILYLAGKIIWREYKFFFTGTGFKFDELKSAASAICKGDPAYVLLGSFWRFDEFSAYVRQFVRDLSQEKLQYVFRVVKGRFRFTASFVAYYLTCGDIDASVQSLFQHVRHNIQTGLDYNQLGEIKDLLQTPNYMIVNKLLYHYMWTGAIPLNDNLPDPAMSVQIGLTTIIHDQLVDNLAKSHNAKTWFTQSICVSTEFKKLLSYVRLTEPLIIEVLHKSIETKSHPDCAYRSVYFDEAKSRCDNTGNDIMRGLLTKNPVTLAFIHLFESPELRHLFESSKLKRLDGCKPLPRKPGLPFCVDAARTRAHAKDTFTKFLEQDFENEKYEFVAIFPGQHTGLFDLAFVARKQGQKKLVIFFVEIKNTSKNLDQHFECLQLSRMSAEQRAQLDKRFQIVRVLIQAGNTMGYTSKRACKTVILGLDDIGIPRHKQTGLAPPPYLRYSFSATTRTQPPPPTNLNRPITDDQVRAVRPSVDQLHNVEKKMTSPMTQSLSHQVASPTSTRKRAIESTDMDQLSLQPRSMSVSPVRPPTKKHKKNL